MSIAVFVSSSCEGAHRLPGVPTPATPGPSFASPTSRAAAVPAGPAMLQIWGHVLGTVPAVSCRILRGPLIGSTVTTRVDVTREADGWVARSWPGDGELELRFRPTGEVTGPGMHLAGDSRGRAVNTIWLGDGGPRGLVSILFAGAGAHLQGTAQDAVPFLSGTLTGAVFFEDPSGPIVSCPLVYWSLQPLGSL